MEIPSIKRIVKELSNSNLKSLPYSTQQENVEVCAKFGALTTCFWSFSLLIQSEGIYCIDHKTKQRLLIDHIDGIIITTKELQQFFNRRCR